MKSIQFDFFLRETNVISIKLKLYKVLSLPMQLQDNLVGALWSFQTVN